MKETLKIVKIGGNIIEDEEKLEAFLKDFANLKAPKILVHGGGKKATQLAEKLGYKTKMFMGRRITDRDNLNIAIICTVSMI